MNETFAKIIGILFNKTTLAYMVLGLGILYINFWFKKSDYSPKIIIERIDDNEVKSELRDKASVMRDSALLIMGNKNTYDISIIKMQMDTVVNHQTPEVIQSLRLMQRISNQMNRNESRNTSETIQPIPPIIKTEPADSKYAETISLIDEIGLTMKSDTSKKKIDKESL
jgi:hypothetical protein